MGKRRKVCSPSQEGPSDGDICAELKEFIVSENSKCVKEIRDSNDRRIAAVEESLSFAMDSLTAMSERQRSADIDILQLQRETAELRRRLQHLELSEDREQQEKRLTSLVFSGPALQSKTSREDAARLIRSLVQQRMEHALDSAQVKAMIRLRNGRVLIDFTTAAPGSDRDVLFRNKTKLKGTGLFVAESLTPRRQAMFSDLLRMKKEGIIFSVFTRSGVILACRSRDSAPIRITDPEATVSAVSAVGCGLRCEAQTPQECSGFIYRPDDGTCRLFSGDCRGPAANSSQLITERYRARVVSAGSTDRCACPAGFSRCAGRCLQRLNTEVNYTTAESQCAALGAHLAVPRSDEENQCATELADAAAWLGVVQVPGVDGQYRGADGCGTVPVMDRWADQQPDKVAFGVVEELVVLLGPGSEYGWPGWHDNPASAAWPPLCQLALSYQLNCL
ncbi:Brevican core protein [Amphibalanus amphitrite]|uniref:Brevican core protein n=1 Tax=Amphibalanus amphitrite TaxID=1232801 RepID=A0A6A4VE36_AMPAM|nr:Brevican core protein [Amphibalanus amphitrite]